VNVSLQIDPLDNMKDLVPWLELFVDPTILIPSEERSTRSNPGCLPEAQKENNPM